MAIRKPITITSLDFDEIKQAIIDKISADATFQDYDFEGSGLNIITDILGYNSHMTSYLANMVANEMFIDSAQLRSAVASVAKQLGYIPRSMTAAVATIDVSVKVPDPSPDPWPSYVTMAKGTKFGTNGNILFATIEDKLLYYAGETYSGGRLYTTEAVDIYQGVWNNFMYTVDINDVDQKFIIPSDQVDTSTLSVTVYPDSASSLGTVYTKNDDINKLDSNSTKYFLHLRADGTYELTFGDGVFGRALEDGEIVKLEYIITDGGNNNISTFTAYQQIEGYLVNTPINVLTKSYGGEDMEDTDSIRHAAPKAFEAQNRAVIVQDYETLLLNKYTFIKSINVWGGQDHDPPQYGKVYVAIQPKYTDILSDTLKNQIKNEVIKSYNVVTTIPEIVDPDYTYVLLNGGVYYDVEHTTKSASEVAEGVIATIQDFFYNYTEKFSSPFFYSNMLSTIDASDVAIENSLFSVLLQKRFTTTVQSNEHVSLYFGNALQEGTITSTIYNQSDGPGVAAKSKIIDDENGTLKVVHPDTGSVIYNDIGSVDYETGELSFNLYVTEYPTDTMDIRIMAEPVKRNVVPKYNQIILLDTSSANLNYERPAGVVVEATSIRTVL